jgi:hypothetical protein
VPASFVIPPVPKLTVPLTVLTPPPLNVNRKFVPLIALPLAGLIVNVFASTYIVDALPIVIVPPHTFVPDTLRNDPAFALPLIVNDSSATLILLYINKLAPLVTLVPPTTLPNDALCLISNIPALTVVKPLYVLADVLNWNVPLPDFVNNNVPLPSSIKPVYVVPVLFPPVFSVIVPADELVTRPKPDTLANEPIVSLYPFISNTVPVALSVTALTFGMFVPLPNCNVPPDIVVVPV